MPDKPTPATKPFAPTSAAHAGATGHDTSARRRYVSEQLLGDHTEVEIQHGAAVYRLRLTSLGKLILTK